MTHHRFAIGLALLATSGCGETGQIAIRSVGEINVARPSSERTALAMGQLALGNVGLALEGFRRAARDDPASVDALLGIAACYDRMARFDLSRRAYEQALALQPNNLALYQALAASLDAEGLGNEAAAIRREATARALPAAAPVVTAAGSVIRLPEPIAPPLPSSVATIEPAQIASPSAPAASVTVILPPARPVAASSARVQSRDERLLGSHRAARLERLSTGEVALLTFSAPLWTSIAHAREPRVAELRREPRPALIVLNAARISGLAARTRTYLTARGFGGARIGDNDRIAARTVIRFAPAERARAMRIAAQFPFATPVAVARGPLTLIVGRDAPVQLLRRA